MTTATISANGLPDLAVVNVHTVCCDANVALCGAVVAGEDRYVDGTASCVLCMLAEGLPCGAPGCDFADEGLAALLALAPAGQPAVHACTDENCPGSTDAVPDPTSQRLCGACRAAAFEPSPSHQDPEDNGG